MKKIHLLLALSLLVSFQACRKEPNQGGETDKPGGKVVFTATLEDLESASSMESFWFPGDQIKIALNDGNTVNATLVDGAGTATASFVATIPSGKTALFAVHPTSALDSADGNTANIGVPDSQSSNSAPEKLAIGKVESGNRISFKNMNAVLGIQLKPGTEVSKVEVSSVNGSALAGIMTVDCSGEVPAV